MIGARGGVDAFEGLVVGAVEDGGAAERVGLLGGRRRSALAARVRRVAAAARGLEASARSRASADHQRTRPRAAGDAVADLLAGVGEHVVEQVAVGRG